MAPLTRRITSAIGLCVILAGCAQHNKYETVEQTNGTRSHRSRVASSSTYNGPNRTARQSSTISQPRESDRQAVLASTREGPPVQDSQYAISYEEFRVHARNHDAVIVDARDPVPYSLGHVQGAINIPAGEKQPYRDRYLKNIDPNQMIMIYCNSASCHSSDMLAEHLIAEGFTNVRVFTPGWQVLSARARDLR
jgi:rhodanese-related sulfurtransferase